MRLLKFILMVSLVSAFGFGCSKDKDKVSELEKEVIQDQSQAAETETPATQDTSAEAAQPAEEHAMTPEAAPTEEPRKEYNQPTGEGFTVQVAAGTNYDYAHELADKFVDRGYDAYVTQATVNGEDFYRIRIGNYPTLTEAKSAGSELQDKYSVDYWVDNSQ